MDLKVFFSRCITIHRKYVISVLIMAIVTIWCLFHSPFHVLSRDFGYLIQVVSILIAVILGFLSSCRINEDHHQGVPHIKTLSASMRSDFFFLLGCIVGLPYLVIMLSSFLFHQCRVLEGSFSFWVSVVPSLLIGLVWGYSVGMLTKKWRYFILVTIGVVLLLVLHDVFNCLFGYHGGSMYVLFGNFPHQRAGALPNSFHLSSRAFLLFMAAGLYEWNRLLFVKQYGPERATNIRVWRPILMTLALILVGWSTQGFTGLGWSHRRIQQYLSQTRETEYLRLYYHPGHHIADETWRKLAWDSYKIAQRMQVSPRNKVDVYIFSSPHELKKYTNSSFYAFAKRGKFYLPERDLNSNTFSHELVHAFHHLYEPSWWIILRRAILEGTAVAFSEGMTLSPEYHETLAILEQEGQLPSIHAIYQDRRFVNHPEPLAYKACGSFIGFLVLEYGVKKYQQFNKTLNFEKTYGYPLNELDTQWKVFLRTIPSDSGEGKHVSKKRHVVQRYAGLTSYTQHCCPQVGVRRRRETTEEQTMPRAWWYNPAESKLVFDELRRLHPETPEWPINYVLSLIANNENTLANTELDTLLEREHEDGVFTYNLYRLKFFLHVLKKDRSGAIDSLQHMNTISEDVESWQALRVQMLQHPTIGPAYFALLTMDDVERRVRLMKLYTFDQEFGPAYLYAFYFKDAYPDPKTKLHFLEEFVKKTPGFRTLKVEAYKEFLDACLRYQLYEEGEYAIRQVNALELSSKDSIDIHEFQERINFEKPRFPQASLFPHYRFRHLYDVRDTNKIW